MDSGIGSLESIPGLLKCLQIQAQATLENIVYSDSRLKKKIPVFLGRFVRVPLQSLQKNANMTQKIIFSNYFGMGIKKSRI